MKRRSLRTGGAMVALSICLAVTPVALAKQERNYEGVAVRERVVRVIRTIQKWLGNVSGNTDVVLPPRPTTP